jgi:FkbM family methyltransferase
VVDIGANRGQFALVARYCFPEARIISFEPLTEPARLFQEIFSNDDLVSLYPFAIGPKSKPALIHLSDKDDSSSLLPITPLQTILFPGTDEKDIRTIPEQPLNAHLSDNDIVPPAMLKLDVQGYELQVLKGCVDLLSSFNYIYVECSFVELYLGQALADEVIAFLYEQNFRLNGIHNIKYDQTGLAIQADFFFRHIGN